MLRPLTILRALRVRHWTKSLLVFTPLLLSHRVTDLTRTGHAALAFVAFCLASSAGYVFNDLIDLRHDQRHRSKSRRPLSAGEISPSSAIVLMVVTGVAGLAASLSINGETFAGIACYLALSAAYTLFVKRIVLADVILLASFYSLRVLTGGAAADIVVSRWLLAFSTFLFLSMALVKRYADLIRAAARPEEAMPGRAYRQADLQVLLSLGTSSGMVSVLVFALYLNSPQVTILYRNTDTLWVVCALLTYWLGRLWLLAHRGGIDDDPILTATRDVQSYAIAAMALVAVKLAV